MNKRKTGFSLIELLVVIAIMSILTTIVYISVNQTRSKSRDQQRISAVLKIKLALEYYYNLNGSYPQALWNVPNPSLSNLSSLPNTSPGKITADDLIPPGGPQDPLGYYYVPLIRGSSTFCNSYHLYTKLESNTSVISSKAGYNSVGESTCGTDSGLKTDASLDPLIYDVRPQ